MKHKLLIFLSILSLIIIQNCTTTEKVSTENQNPKSAKTDDDAIYKEVQDLKTMLGYASGNATSTETKKRAVQPLEFGVSVNKVREIFPAPDKFEFAPMRNEKVTMLSRNSGGGRFTFFFYQDKLYKIIIVTKWSSLKIKYSEDDIKKTEEIFIEGNGKPDLVEKDEAHKKMIWLRDDMEITLEVFNLMSHQGMNRVMSLMYTDSNISPLAKGYESFELYKTNHKKVLDR